MKSKKYKIKIGDQVQVIAGKEKGKKGEVLAINSKSDRVYIKDVNKGKKHIKKTFNQAGSTVETERSIHISNVLPIDPKTSKPTRVGYKQLEGKKKVRIAKKSGQELK